MLLRGSQRSAEILSLGSRLSCCCPQWWWLFCFVFLRCRLWWQHGALSMMVSWNKVSPCDLHMQSVLHFWKGFFHSALFIEFATLDVDCTLKTPAEFCSLSSTFILFSSSFLCNRQEFFCVCSKHHCFNFPQSHICSSLLPMGF